MRSILNFIRAVHVEGHGAAAAEGGDRKSRGVLVLQPCGHDDAAERVTVRLDLDVMPAEEAPPALFGAIEGAVGGKPHAHGLHRLDALLQKDGLESARGDAEELLFRHILHLFPRIAVGGHDEPALGVEIEETQVQKVEVIGA